MFYKTFFDCNFICVNEVLFHLINLDSYNIIISKQVGKIIFLTLAGLRHTIPSPLKMGSYTFMSSSPSLVINDKDYNILTKKSKDYYSLLLCKKDKFPNGSLALKREFDQTGNQLQKVYILPHTYCCEPYIKAFQYKVLNSILYTNTKLYKIGFVTDDTCSFCKSHPENFIHLFFDCIYSQSFWIELYFHFISKEFVSISLKDVIIGIIDSKRPLLN